MAEKLFDLSGKRVWVAGHRGMVGSALVRELETRNCRILTVGRDELDLRRQSDTEAWIDANRPDAIFVSAATVGGILANDTRPADFIHDNLAIVHNIVHGAHLASTGKLMFLGSSCIYPRLAKQPMAEADLLTGPLEPTNQWYAVAKIAGIKLCQAYRRQYGDDFIVVVPTNLFGPGDNCDPAASHVVPAMIRKITEARKSGGPVEIWGTGRPRREFLYVDDAARALIFLMEHYSAEDVINIGAGESVSISELAQLVASEVGYSGGFHYATEKPDGMPRKQLDSTRILELGWRPRVSLREGLRMTIDWLQENAA
ncbi:MAG: GDP-L-fucose synthase [Kiloniellales bacterium]|nr:GDP-L-fucose synthase [Kiloniellales bacterium]